MTFKEYIEKFNIKYDTTYLECSNKGLTDLDGIESLINLEWLTCHNNRLKDLHGIENLTNLKYLSCNHNRLTDLKGIENLTNLTDLYCWSNEITSLKQIDRLKHLKHLKSDITNDIDEARKLILPEIRIDKISDIDYDI